MSAFVPVIAFGLGMVAVILGVDIAATIRDDQPARKPEPPGPLDAAFAAAPALRLLPGWQPDATADPCDVVRAAYETNVIEKVYRGLSQPEAEGPAIRVLATWWLERRQYDDTRVDWFGQPTDERKLVSVG